MINLLITFLIAALVLYIVYFVCSMFLSGRPLQIVAIILGLVLLVYALKILGVALP